MVRRGWCGIRGRLSCPLSFQDRVLWCRGFWVRGLALEARARGGGRWKVSGRRALFSMVGLHAADMYEAHGWWVSGMCRLDSRRA